MSVGVLVAVAAGVFFATSGSAAAPKAGGQATLATSSASAIRADTGWGGWIKIRWQAACPFAASVGQPLSNWSWGVGYQLTDQFGGQPLVSGTSSAFGGPSIIGKTSASGSIDNFVYMRAGLSRETFHAAVKLDCINPNLKDATHPNGMHELINIGALSVTFFKGPEPKKPESAIDGIVQSVSGCETGSCSLKPQAGVSVDAAGSSGSGSATTGSDGSYSIAVPEGVYTVTPSYPEHTFTPPSKRVSVGSSNATANFKTCSAISTTVNATMQRSGVARAASSVPFKGGSTKNFVRVVYTPCGTSGTVKVAWQVRPQCQASAGNSLNIDPYTKKPWPTYWQFPKSGDGPYALDSSNHVNLNDSSGALVMSITVLKGLGSATVEIYDTHGTLVRQLPNEINGAGGEMNCRPQADKLTLKPE